jgi:predicted ABC-class ATPase
VRKRPALKDVYIDPSPVASTNFNYPKQWKLGCKELDARKTLKEKEDLRDKKILIESLKVAAYIALCFKNLQQHDSIWILYHFK